MFALFQSAQQCSQPNSHNSETHEYMLCLILSSPGSSVLLHLVQRPSVDLSIGATGECGMPPNPAVEGAQQCSQPKSYNSKTSIQFIPAPSSGGQTADAASAAQSQPHSSQRIIRAMGITHAVCCCRLLQVISCLVSSSAYDQTQQQVRGRSLV